MRTAVIISECIWVKLYILACILGMYVVLPMTPPLVKEGQNTCWLPVPLTCSDSTHAVQCHLKKLNHLHDAAILCSTPEHIGQVGSSGNPLHTPSVTTKHTQRFLHVQIMDTDLTVCCSGHNCAVTGWWQELTDKKATSVHTQQSLCIKIQPVITEEQEGCLFWQKNQNKEQSVFCDWRIRIKEQEECSFWQKKKTESKSKVFTVTEESGSESMREVHFDRKIRIKLFKKQCAYCDKRIRIKEQEGCSFWQKNQNQRVKCLLWQKNQDQRWGGMPTLTEKMFPWCPVRMMATERCRKGSQMMTCTSSEPLANRLNTHR